MIIIYLIIGIITAIVSALPFGASNIAVINTTLKQNAKQAFKIAIASGIAEVILSYYALHCNTVIKEFFSDNLWVQITLVFVFFIVGGFLFFKKFPNDKSEKKQLIQSKYVTGFLLGIINPPVLIYWVITYGILKNNDIVLSLQSSFSVLFLFFFGVYLGKLLTLYFYSRISILIKNEVQNIAFMINKVTGVLLISISFIQAIKIYIT
ncbi:hypothetical protein A8C32_10500 [Flavivirga aquatica]|uniref:Lysine transporter LysE n=1 Tax=Flavivirga aquatica TaxID=1849968 RepID=A0A1E5TCQ7_9FLAO|nr:hypothetical protein [Flavivirga aquatica]OEK09154.1 hypothetical protein A8C32_10500 [Flavivirga aquatica]